MENKQKNIIECLVKLNRERVLSKHILLSADRQYPFCKIPRPDKEKEEKNWTQRLKLTICAKIMLHTMGLGTVFTSLFSSSLLFAPFSTERVALSPSIVSCIEIRCSYVFVNPIIASMALSKLRKSYAKLNELSTRVFVYSSKWAEIAFASVFCALCQKKWANDKKHKSPSSRFDIFFTALVIV